MKIWEGGGDIAAHCGHVGCGLEVIGLAMTTRIQCDDTAAVVAAPFHLMVPITDVACKTVDENYCRFYAGVVGIMYLLCWHDFCFCFASVLIIYGCINNGGCEHDGLLFIVEHAGNLWHPGEHSTIVVIYGIFDGRLDGLLYDPHDSINDSEDTDSEGTLIR